MDNSKDEEIRKKIENSRCAYCGKPPGRLAHVEGLTPQVACFNTACPAFLSSFFLVCYSDRVVEKELRDIVEALSNGIKNILETVSSYSDLIAPDDIIKLKKLHMLNTANSIQQEQSNGR